MQCMWLSSLRSLWTGLLSALTSTSFFSLPFSSFLHCFPRFLSPHFSVSTFISFLFLSLHLNLSVSSIPLFPSLVTSMFPPSSSVFSLLFFSILLFLISLLPFSNLFSWTHEYFLLLISGWVMHAGPKLVALLLPHTYNPISTHTFRQSRAEDLYNLNEPDSRPTDPNLDKWCSIVCW